MLGILNVTEGVMRGHAAQIAAFSQRSISVRGAVGLTAAPSKSVIDLGRMKETNAQVGSATRN